MSNWFSLIPCRFSGILAIAALSTAVVLGIASSCVAQTSEAGAAPKESQPLAGDIFLSFRARVPTNGRIESGLHSTMLCLQTNNGVMPAHLRFNAFGLAQYGSFRWQNAVLEAELPPLRVSAAPQRLQVGILRLPFGIYDYRETYGSGLIDYPMPRVDYAFNAVDWGAPGVGWIGSTERVQLETAVVNGKGAGIWGNINRLTGRVGRVQAFLPPGIILGVSGWSGDLETYPGTGRRRPVDLGGLDWRITMSHLVLRGEMIGGTLSGSQTKGAYFDTYYRLPGWEKWTMVSRLEGLKPSRTEPFARQVTLGARYSLLSDWTLSANWRKNNMDRAYNFTWTKPAPGRGDLLFQALYQRRFQ